jgi:hypothetical protein
LYSVERVGISSKVTGILSGGVCSLGGVDLRGGVDSGADVLMGFAR